MGEVLRRDFFDFSGMLGLLRCLFLFCCCCHYFVVGVGIGFDFFKPAHSFIAFVYLFFHYSQS